MKNLKQIVAGVIAEVKAPTEQLIGKLWQLICYSPKWPLRLQQEQLLVKAEHITLTVRDEHFSKKDVAFNGFIWGDGSRKVMFTHGWGSKGADFIDIITPLKEIPDLQIIAFDAPGNGSSFAELSNLSLFSEAVKAIFKKYGAPDILIGHSLGAMANIIALQDLSITPKLLISLTPLVKLKENFESTMTSVGVAPADQEAFLSNFEDILHIPASHFDLDTLYQLDNQLNHWVFYDEHDNTAPYAYLETFLKNHPYIKNRNYDEVGHERIIKSSLVVADVVGLVKDALNQQ